MFRKATELFYSGKIEECHAVLNQIHLDKFSINAWIQQNNIYVCQSIMDIRHHQISYKSNLPYSNLLKQVKGVPGDSRLFATETTVIYNICCSQMNLEIEPCVLLQLANKLISNLMRRVCSSSCMKVRECDHVTTNITNGNCAERLTHQLESVIAHSKTGACSYYWKIVLLFCAYCLILMSNRKYQEALDITEKMYTRCVTRTTLHDKEQENPDDDCLLTLPLNMYGTQFTSRHSIEQLVYITYSVSLYSTHQYTRCVQVLQVISHDKLQDTAKYMKASLFFAQGQYSSCVKEIRSLQANFTHSFNVCKLHNLIGKCFAKLVKPHSAIQQFQFALENDFTYNIPLYYIALQYRSLGLVDSELEAFNLLVTSLEKEPSTSQQHHFYSMDAFLQDPTAISLVEAMYALASRCLQLNKYNIAVRRYMQLLGRLHGGCVLDCESSVIGVPTIAVIYHEAAWSLLKDQQYAECIIVCDQAISSHPTKQTNQGVSTSSRKRLQSSDETMGECWLPSAAIDVVALKYKAKAFSLMHEAEKAHDVLDNIINALEILVEETSSSILPQTKKLRLDQSESEVTEITSFAGTNATNNIHNLPPCVFLAEVYSDKSNLLIKENNLKSAVKWSRLALQLAPDIQPIIEEHCYLLKKLSMTREAAACWLQYRHIGTHLDAIAVQLMLKRMPNDTREEQMDKEMLQLLLKV